MLAASMAGATGSVGRLAVTLPMITAELSGTAQAYAIIDAVLPMLVAGPYGRITAMLPMMQASLSGRTVIAVTYEAYAVNLKPKARYREELVNEVTRYTNYPFNQVIRFQNQYLGIADNGVYLIGGATDNAAAIPWAWKTALTDNKAPQLKRPVSAYFSGRVGQAATVTLYTGESGSNAYSYSTPRDATPQNYRQKFGLGVRTRYYALGMAGTAALELDKINMEVAQLSRKLKGI